MLAVDVGLLTKKFQHQSLEEGQPAANIKLVSILTELQVRGGIEDDSKIIFFISQ